MRKTICVVGLGQFGSELAKELAKKCDVLALDLNEERVNAIVDHVQRAVIVDSRDFASLSALVHAGFDEAIVSLGESIEASILCTLHLKKIGVKRIRAKAVTEDHAAILKAVGASDTIFPERETARRVAGQIVNPNLLDFVPLAEDYEVIQAKSPVEFHGRSLLDLGLRERYKAMVLAVAHPQQEKVVFLPGPDYVIKLNDVLILVGRIRDLERLEAETAND
ncbi:MAG: TrkA family potassium uptake protein [Thermodesulfobacteriota bacterium]